MFHTIFSHEVFKWFVTEILTPIANNGFWYPEPGKYVGFQEFEYHPVVIGFAGDCFNPLGHIVHSHQYIRVTIGRGEGSHEIDAPNIKKFDH